VSTSSAHLMIRLAALMVLVLGPAAAFTPSALRQPRLTPPQRVAALPSHQLALAPHSRTTAVVVMAAQARSRTLTSPAGVSAALMRIGLAITTSLLAIFLRVGRAVAAERTVRAASAAPFVLSGNTVKWTVVTAALGAMYVFRREETPILTETVMTEEEQSASRPAAAASTDVDALAPEAVATEPVDDVSLNADLFRRMQALAAQRAEEDDEDASSPPAPPSDSTDSWGVGNTAVLEPPGGEADTPAPEGVLDGEPAVEFPPGFPLVDREEDIVPAASADQIAMLQRMFGTTTAEE